MGVLFSYFAATSDDVAAAVIDLPSGPGAGSTVLATIEVADVDPVVQLGTLESLLTGAGYSEVIGKPRQGHPLAVRDGGECLVLTITDELRDALATASNTALHTVAGRWAATDEFGGQAEPEMLVDILQELAGLARSARAGTGKLYCWLRV
ncbi:MAG TPA: hypothetical protein VHW44_06480 [Pseudonocardiaceae bacterium]|jgi:hypothetical protein|nr:hypothetical protein [Pseudonocardiaceae bacterium]